MPVHRPEIAALVGPFVPDTDAMILQIFDVGVAGEKPEQLVDNRLQMQLLGRQHWEAVGQVEAHLMSENRQRTRAGAIVLLDAAVEDRLYEIEVLAHGRPFPAPNMGESNRGGNAA